MFSKPRRMRGAGGRRKGGRTRVGNTHGPKLVAGRAVEACRDDDEVGVELAGDGGEDVLEERDVVGIAHAGEEEGTVHGEARALEEE